jgi:peptidoglycan/xylan/chitin deacetylase (PgdA/CDA1 family)
MSAAHRTRQSRTAAVLFFLLAAFNLVSCASRSSADVPPLTVDQQVATQLAEVQATQAANLALTPTIPPPTPTATPFVLQNPITATVWQADPVVAILLYHRYIPIDKTNDSRMKMQLSDFRGQLDQLYAAGFVQVSLEDWLAGKLDVPQGKRPVIITFDDLFFADQVYIMEDGTPSERSGLGVMWQVYQEHPDFGFKPALFSNMGDKYYGNVIRGDWFYVETGWQDSLARVIAWCIEHGALVYNHFYTHPSLPKLSPAQIEWEMRTNDEEIKKFLTRAEKPELATVSANIISLTYGEWPNSSGGRKTILDYVSPLGKPVIAVVEAEPYYTHNLLTLAPYAAGFTPYHIPRVEGQQENIDALIADLASIPAAGSCQLNNPTPERLTDPEYVQSIIAQSIAQGLCGQGIYAVAGMVFDARSGNVVQVKLPDYPREY